MTICRGSRIVPGREELRIRRMLEMKRIRKGAEASPVFLYLRVSAASAVSVIFRVRSRSASTYGQSIAPPANKKSPRQSDGCRGDRESLTRRSRYSSSADGAEALQHDFTEPAAASLQQARPLSQHSFPSTQHLGAESQQARFFAQHAFPSAQQFGFTAALQQARLPSQHLRFFWQQSADGLGATPIVATVRPAVAKTTANSLDNIVVLLCDR